MPAYLFKKATVYITATGVPAAAGDAIRTEEVTLSFANAETNRRPTGGAAMGQGKTFVGGVDGAVTIKFPIKGGGSLGIAPDWGEAFKACNMTEAIVGSTSVEYTPSNGVPARYRVTVEVPDITAASTKAYSVILDGCVGNLTLEAERNGPVFASVELKGVFAEPTEQSSALNASGLDTTTAFNFKGTSVSLLGITTHIIEGFTFDLGMEIGMRASLAAADGFVSAIGHSRAPTGTLNPEIPTPTGSADLYTKMTDETQGALDFGTIPSTPVSGETVLITFPKAQIVGVSLSERAGMLVGDVTLDFAETPSSTGGSADDISIFID